MIRLADLTVARAGKPLFTGASLVINPQERLALIGANGSGKSSLIEVLRGELSPEAGDIQMPALRIGWLAQQPPRSRLSALRHVMAADRELAAAEQAVTQAQAGGDGTAIALAYDRWVEVGGPSAQARAAELLSGLGFDEALQQRTVDELSGGWKMRLNLACVLMVPADLLLLDEPTNHLDLDAVLWLERQLLRHQAIQLIVSHDRDFLDRVATACLVIEHGRLERYPGGYTASEAIRAEHAAQRERDRRAQQQRIEHLNAYISRFRAKATKARQAQSRLKQLERIQVLAPLRAASGIDFEFPVPPRGPDPLIRVADLACGYAPGQPVIRVPELVIRRGARIGILGRNGSGKTTLIRTLLGEQDPLGGELVRAPTLAVGYLAQQSVEQLREDESALQQFARIAPDEREQALRAWLGRFGFGGEDATRLVGPMSGGEKARLGLAMMVWRRPGFLVLDEPTNHLDALTRDALADALADFEGPLLLVSHDRYLLRATVDEFLLVDQGVLRPFDGDLDDYARWLQQDRSATRPAAAFAPGGSDPESAARADSARAAAPEAPARAEDRREDRRERARARAAASALRQPIERRIRRVEDLLARHQARAAEIDTALAQPDAFSDADAAGDLGRERAHLAREIETLEEEWLQLHAEIEALEQNRG
ncbi:MAG: ABC-F family ATP-binding cassette domain-containing protein [Burkholderiaceae bacterium]|nr:ABC-F family ATP-binding cassette domain-containing protein [Burkholderiaceae bacterium]